MYDLPRNMQVRPIVRWPGPLTPEHQRRHSPFSANWRSTMGLLERELRQLGAQATVLQVAMTESDFRIDGFPRANARASHPGIILSFDTTGWPQASALHGRLEFAVDLFRDWQENLRAVALGLEALRKIDRYGITRGDAQYAGFKALPRGDDGAMGLYTKEAARDFINDRYGGDVRLAIRQTHPDTNPGADPDEYRRVIRAKELLEA
jgi:hypothetical protein